MPVRVLRGGDVRLRSVDEAEYVETALPWYQDPDVLELSEEGAPPYDRERLQRMYEVTSRKGEVYVIEIRTLGDWRAVGDAALLVDAVPVNIGVPAVRSQGIGSQALLLLLDRARELGWATVKVSGVLAQNRPAVRMYERAGFVPCGEPRLDSRGHRLIPMQRRLA